MHLQRLISVVSLGLALALACSVPVFAERDFRDYPVGRDDGINWDYPQPSRVVSIGDLHADPVALVSILLFEHLIDEQGDWIGGDAHLVVLGDILHRGPNSRFCLDLLRRLTRQARAVKGRVHVLNGHHEMMVTQGDFFRYSALSDEQAYSDFALPADPARLAENLENFRIHRSLVYAFVSRREVRERVEVMELVRRKQGYHRAMTQIDSPYAQDLRSRNTILKIGKTLYVHAGLHKWLLYAPDDHIGRINTLARERFRRWQEYNSGLSKNKPDPSNWMEEPGGEGPLWTRAMGTRLFPEWMLREVLVTNDAVRVVHGHNVTESKRIEKRWGGLAYGIDTGCSSYYSGKLSSLTIFADDSVLPHDGDTIPRSTEAAELVTRLQSEFDRMKGPATSGYEVPMGWCLRQVKRIGDRLLGAGGP